MIDISEKTYSNTKIKISGKYEKTTSFEDDTKSILDNTMVKHCENTLSFIHKHPTLQNHIVNAIIEAHERFTTAKLRPNLKLDIFTTFEGDSYLRLLIYHNFSFPKGRLQLKRMNKEFIRPIRKATNDLLSLREFSKDACI